MTSPKTWRKFRAKICQHTIQTTEPSAPNFCSEECKIKDARIIAQFKRNDPHDRIKTPKPKNYTVNYQIQMRKK